MSASDNLEIVAYTVPDEFGALHELDPLAYERVIALWHNDGNFGERIGERDTRGRQEKRLTLPSDIGRRIYLVASLTC